MRISKGTVTCGSCDCPIPQRRPRLQCKGVCGRSFHIPCTDVPLELYHSVCKYPSLAWRCDNCRVRTDFVNPHLLNEYFLEKVKNIVGEMEERFNCFKEELIKNSFGRYREFLGKKLAYEAVEKRKEILRRNKKNDRVEVRVECFFSMLFVMM